MLEKMQKGFFIFINVALFIIFIPIIIGALYKGQTSLGSFGSMDIVLLIMLLLLIAALVIMQKKKVKSTYILIFTVAIGFILRFIYICSIDSIPVSDYKTMMEAAQAALSEQYVYFKGTAYMSRFPHLIIPTLYFSTIMSFTSNYLWIIKFINVLLSTISIVTVYFIGKEVFNSAKKAQWLSFIMAVYPPVIVYTATYAPENIAMPFYLLSIYFLIRVVKNKVNPIVGLVAGMMLSFANMFRAVAMVMLIAFIMYIWICNENKTRKKIINTIVLIVGFTVPMFIVSNTLLSKNITDSHLWVSAEPSITNILKGTNIESGGSWNPEDAALVEELNFDKDKIEERAKEIIIDRLTTTPIGTLTNFYYNKLVNQWRSGDFSAVYWAEHSVNDDGSQLMLSKGGAVYIQCFYIVLLALCYIGLINKKRNFREKTINLFYIILGGYGMFYLISEAQERYAFIVCWVFIILAVNGLEVLTARFIKDE